MTAVFWICAAAIVYTFIGYPVLIALWARTKPRPPAPQWHRPLPTVSIMTPVAHNEGARIDRRIDDLLALAYPADRIEIIVASDGSTDDTVARVRRHGTCGRIRVMNLPQRRGKAAALADAALLARHEILVLCDTRQRLPPDTLVELVARFDEPEVGAVSGTLAPATEGNAVASGLGAYWRYETFLRRCESDVDSLVGATGALYAIRRQLFLAPGPDTLLDDVMIPLAAVRAGYRVVFAPRARAIEEVPANASDEWRRRVRTLAGCFQLFAREPWVFDPRRNRIWLQLMSHKLLRLVTPALLLLLFAASWALGGSPFYRLALSAQCVFYAAGGIGLFAKRVRSFALPATFMLLQAAVIVGMFRYFSGRQPATWKREPGSR